MGIFLGSQGNAIQSVLHVGINSHLGMPFVRIKREAGRETLDGGALKDLGAALGEELKAPVEFILLPRARIAENLVSGRVDLVCHISPLWYPQIAKSVDWTSQALYQTTNILVYFRRHKFVSLQEVKGQSVGTLYDFVYQNYEDLFAKKDLIREDATTSENNIQKLIKDRLPLVLLSSPEFNYYKTQYPDLKSFDPGWGQVDAHCALSQKSPFHIKQIDKILSKIKRKDFINKSFFLGRI